MGGKQSTSTQGVTIPPSVLAQYNSVNSKANTTAQTPFQQYSGQFVAPVSSEQQTGITNTNQSAEEAQPYYDAATGTLGNTQAGVNPVNEAATGLAAASAQGVNATPLTGDAINSYLSPYLGDVLGTTNALANQNNNIAQSGELGTAISSGAFGGDRTGLAAANLNQQNSLAEQSTDANILNTGYQTALGTAQQQQGVNLSAQQANRAALASAGSELAGIGSTAYGEGANTASELGQLGTGAESAGLAGAQAEIGAGTVEQQTQQAQDTAEYNQFLQQQSYPFQVDQFLANIAEGTGALSGSTTTTTQPGGFFSDKRLKHDIKKVGKTFDGQMIYSYKMHGDPRTHIGLIAQDVERKRPEAVGLAAGYKTVDYGKATEKAANRGHFREGGVAGRRVYAMGGGPSIVDAGDLSQILAAQQQMYAPMSGGAGVYGGAPGAAVPRGGSSRVPAPSGAVPHLVTAEGSLRQQPTGMQNVSGAATLAKQGQGIYNDYEKAHPAVPVRSTTTTTTPGGLAPAPTSNWSSPGADFDGSGLGAAAAPANDPDYDGSTMARGGRLGLASGGDPYSYDSDPTALGIPDENPHNQLAKAPDLPKQAPTGFQQLMSMGQGMGGMSSMGSSIGGMFGGSGGAGAAADAGSDWGDAADVVADAARGGRQKRDDGGPVDAASSDRNSDVSADTPDTSIDVAPALAVGAPNTSLDAPMQYAKDAYEAYGIYGALAAAAAKRGGRIGMADGGDPGDADPTADPDVTPAPVAAAPASGGVSGWWNKNKGTVLPILQGLGAMGTAPTKHFGVALAAGLGAGAGAYAPTQEGLASAAQTQAQTRGVDIANQIAQQKLNYLKTSSPLPSPLASAPPSQGSYAPADLRKQYYVPPILPDEMAKLQDAYRKKLVLGDAPVQAQMAAIKNRVDAQTSANQNDARQNYDDAYSVATKAQDPELRASASSVADAYQQWTGDKIDSKDGVLLNGRTNKPPIGDQAQRLSPSKYADLMNDAMTKVPVPTGVPGETKLMPKWQINGGNSAADYVSRLPPTGTPGVGAPPAATTPAAPVRQIRPPASVAPAAPVASQPAMPSPVDAKAYSDPKYKLAPVPTQIGTTPSNAVANQMTATSATRAQLQADAEQAAQSTGSALQFAQAAKNIMDSKGAPAVGLAGSVAKTISSVFGGVDATNYQEVAKYLGNLAVQSGKGNFPHATEKENMVQFNDLSPSVKQTGDALYDLLNTNINNLQYTLDTANRTTGYLDPKGYNGDPQKFFRWNQEHYPRADVVNAPSNVVTVKTKADYDALPKGATYTHNGKTGVKQ